MSHFKVVAPRTDSIVDYLNKLGFESNYEAREILASDYGIENYEGKAEQNTKLLERLRWNWGSFDEQFVGVKVGEDTEATFGKKTFVISIKEKE